MGHLHLHGSQNLGSYRVTNLFKPGRFEHHASPARFERHAAHPYFPHALRAYPPGLTTHTQSMNSSPHANPLNYANLAAVTCTQQIPTRLFLQATYLAPILRLLVLLICLHLVL